MTSGGCESETSEIVDDPAEKSGSAAGALRRLRLTWVKILQHVRDVGDLLPAPVVPVVRRRHAGSVVEWGRRARAAGVRQRRRREHLGRAPVLDFLPFWGAFNRFFIHYAVFIGRRL